MGWGGGNDIERLWGGGAGVGGGGRGVMTLKGAIRDLFSSLLRHELSPIHMLTSQSCENYVQYIGRLSRATHVPRDTNGQLSC